MRDVCVFVACAKFMKPCPLTRLPTFSLSHFPTFSPAPGQARRAVPLWLRLRRAVFTSRVTFHASRFCVLTAPDACHSFASAYAQRRERQTRIAHRVDGGVRAVADSRDAAAEFQRGLRHRLLRWPLLCAFDGVVAADGHADRHG